MGAIFAEEPQASVDRLRAAEAASSLDTKGTTPWHVKLAVQIYDDKGKANEEGTIEEWWYGPRLTRIVYAMPSYRVTTITNGGETFETKSAEPLPMLLYWLLQEVVHPLPNLNNLDEAELTAHRRKVGSVDFDCVKIERSRSPSTGHMDDFSSTYCLDRGKDTIRLSSNSDSLFIVRSRMGSFLNRSVPLDPTISLNGLKLAAAQVVKLQTNPISKLDVDLTPDLQPAAARVTVDDTLFTGGKIVKKVPPVYPYASKQNHTTGTVLLQAVIGTDGRLRSLKLIGAPDPYMGASALQSVRQWVFEPTLLNGVATERDRVIAVHFSMGH